LARWERPRKPTPPRVLFSTKRSKSRASAAERPKVWICPALRRGRDGGGTAIVHPVTRHAISIERENGDVICEHCLLADTPWTRLRGLLGRRGLGADEGLLLRPAGSVHTLFMRFRIDVI